MRKPRGYANHTVAPSSWRRTSNITGDYEMDASILHCKNKSVPAKIKDHVAPSGPGYGPLTAYDGYSNYSGDS